jgi:hypothetical protein
MAIFGKLFRTARHVMFGALAALVLTEALLQLIASSSIAKVLPVVEPELGQPDKDIGYAFVPGARALWTRENRARIGINSLGLRDREVTPHKPAGLFRVALSGNSMVEALQVENQFLFDNLSEDILRNNGHNVEIVNFAMSGNGPLRQLVRLEKFAVPLKPDMTIMMLSSVDFMSGELGDDSENPGYQKNRVGEIVRSYGFRQRASQRYADTFLGRSFFFLMHHSHLFRMIYQKRRNSLEKFLGITFPSFATNSDDRPAMKTSLCNAAHIQKLYEFWVDHKPHTSWLFTKQFLAETSDYADRNPIIISMAITSIDKSCSREAVIRNTIIENIRSIMAQNNIVFVDWNRELLDFISKNEAVSLKQDLLGFGSSLGGGHLNYRGHSVYAQILNKLLVPHLTN